MSGLADLVENAQPALGYFAPASSGVAGASWRYVFVEFFDNDGEPIDFSGVTAQANLYDSSGTVAAEFTFTGDDAGGFVLELDQETTATLTTDERRNRYSWSLVVDDDGDTVQWWLAQDNAFYVYAT